MSIPKPLMLSLFWLSALAAAAEQAPVIYPLDRATILAGSKFDIKVEFPGITDEAAIKVTLNDQTLNEVFGRDATFIETEDSGGKAKWLADDPDLDDFDDFDFGMASAILLRDCVLTKPGAYTLVATDGITSATVKWEVYRPPARRVAKNVVLMIGDGMSLAHRTAARMMSKNLKQGKYSGPLAMDAMPHMALLGTSGVDHIVTDSANSAHAYTTGHKSSNAAMGVYADRTKSVFDDPRVETLGFLVKRMKQMSVGIVTTSEVQDATPAAWVACTRSRGERAAITESFLELQPDVLMGGGRSVFLSKMGPEKKRYETDYLSKFTAAGYTYAKTFSDMKDAAADPKTVRLLGLFHSSNMDGVLDREFLRKGTVDKFPDQPGLVEMTQTALQILSRNENGFALLVESALIDKFSHKLDWERAVMDTIMFDKAIAAVKEFAAKNNDTLVLVTSDHGHCLSISGVIDDSRKGPLMRDKIGGGYPNYVDADADGYPDSLDVSKRLAIFFSAYPDYYETYRPKLDGPFNPARMKATLPPAIGPNDKYRDIPGAVFREGSLPRNAGAASHAADDVILTAIGPGSEGVSGFMDNTEVFRVIANALSLGTEAEKEKP